MHVPRHWLGVLPCRPLPLQIHQTVTSGGKVLVPVFAVGRAQELLMLLDEHWQRTQLEVR